MNITFDFYKNRRNPSLILCNPNGEELYSMAMAKNRQVYIALNQMSELTFDLPKYTDSDTITPYYEDIRVKRLVKLEGFGQFIITNIETTTDGVVESKVITCKGLEFELSSKNLDLIEGTYALYNPTETSKSLLHIVMGYIPTWSIGEVDSELWNTWRTFELKDNNIFNFLMSEVQEAFDCVFTFDTFNRTISAIKTDNLKIKTDIFLSSRNLMKELNISENSDNIITALNVYGDGDLSIHGVNPLGTSTVYDLSYFTSVEWMTEGLVNAVKAWESKIEEAEKTYAEKLLKIKQLNTELISLETQLREIEAQRKALEQQHSLAVVAGDNENCAIYSSKIKEKDSEIENKKGLISDKKHEIDVVQKELTFITSTLSFETNFTEEQRKELSNFIYQSSTQNTNFSITEITTPQERREIMQELYEWGKKQLKKSSQPIWEFTIDSINFLNLIEYKETIRQMQLGVEITIEVDKSKDLFAKALLLGFRMDLDNPTDLELNFSNVLNFKGTTYTFEELFNDTATISKTMDFESKDWGLAKEAHNRINEYINNALDLTNTEIISSDNQEFTISNVGIRGREKERDGDGYLPEEIWINKNTIAFSDDNFNSTKMALGKILLPDGTKAYGLIGDYIVGRVLCGQKLILENEKSTFRVDGDKVYIKNADIIMTSDGGKEETLEDALKNASENGGNSVFQQPTPPTEAKEGDLWADTSNKNKLHRYDGSQWVSIKDGTIDEVKNKIDSVTDSSGNLNASKVVGQILTGKSNIVCGTDGTTGSVLALNENGIIVGTRSSNGSINTTGGLTCITKDGIIADSIKSGGTIQGVTLKGTTIIGGNQSGVHTLIAPDEPFKIKRGSNGIVAEIWAHSTGGAPYFRLFSHDSKEGEEAKMELKAGGSFCSMDLNETRFDINVSSNPQQEVTGEMHINVDKSFYVFKEGKMWLGIADNNVCYYGRTGYHTYIDGYVYLENPRSMNISELEVKNLELEHENKQLGLRQSELEVVLMERGVI